MTSSRTARPAVHTAHPTRRQPSVAANAGGPPARGVTSETRLVLGILLGVASGLVGFAWLAFGGLLMAYPQGTAVSRRETWLVMAAVGLLIALSGLGAIGMASTARRPGGSRWVRAWVWTAAVGGGPVAVIFAGSLIWLQVRGS